MPWREHLPQQLRIYSALTSHLQWNQRLNKMALVVNPSHMSQKLWREEQPENLINVFLKMWDGKTLCCLINPRQAAITSIGILEQKVVESYPDQSREDFFLETQSKPLNEYSFNSLTWNEGATVFVQYRKRGGCFIFSFSILCIIFMAIVGSFFTCGCSLLIIPILLPFLFILPFFCL